MNKFPPEDNLYGQVFMDYFQSNLKGEAYLLRDDGYRDLFEVKEYFSSPDNFAPVENSLLKFAKPDKVLDIGCGAGRFSLYFQDLGWNVTAVDNSPLIAEMARMRGVKRVINEDILTARLPFEHFNTILLLGNNIGISGTLDGAEKLLQKLFHTCAGGGRLLLTGLNISKTQEKHHLSYHEARRKEGRYIGEVRLRMEYDNRVGHWFPWLRVDSEVLARIAQKTGWNVKELIDEYFYGMVLEKTGGVIPS